MALENGVAIVTGGGRNIGEAVAHRFANAGVNVAVVDLRIDAANAVASAINVRRSGSALAIAADVSSPEDYQRVVKEVVDRWGSIDILVSNAAITDRRTLFELTLEEWNQVLGVNLTGVFLGAKYVGKQMADQGRGGRIINIASTSGHRGRQSGMAYSAAKGGVLNLTRSLAIALAPHGIRVNSVSPNRIGSPVGQESAPEGGREVVNLVGRPGTPEDIAAAVEFLASEGGDFVSGTDLLVDGGSMAGPFSPTA